MLEVLPTTATVAASDVAAAAADVAAAPVVAPTIPDLVSWPRPLAPTALTTEGDGDGLL